MAKKISQLTQATEVKSDDVTVIVQDGETKKLPLNMMVTKQDIENKKIAGLAKLDEIEATYENDTYTPTITVKNKSSVKTGEGDEVDYSANVMDGHAKSAILRGQTLKNINDYRISVDSNVTIGADGTITINANGKYTEVFLPTLEKLPSTKYWVGINVIENTLNGDFNICAPTGDNCIFNSFFSIAQGFVGVKEQVLTTMTDLSSAIYTFRSYLSRTVTEGVIKYKVMVIPYQEGMENWGIPYFAGMQSVKMPVLKTFNNIVDFSNEKLEFEYGVYLGQKGDGTDQVNNKGVPSSFVYTLNYINILDSKDKMRFYGNDTIIDRIVWFDENKNQVGLLVGANNRTFNIPTGAKYFRFLLNDSRFTEGKELAKDNIGHYNIYYGDESQIFNNEPHKSNILSAPSDLVLRGIGEVQDELNCLTGEVTERIGEVVLDGSDSSIVYRHQTTDENTLRFFIECFGYNTSINTSVPFLTDSNIPKKNNYSIDEESIFSNWGGLFIRIAKEKLTENSVEGFKLWLSQNPITVQYPLATESVKTVDLIPSGTHPSTTPYCWKDGHIQLSSSGLLPNLEYSVVTSRAGQINQNATMIVKNDKRIFDLEILLAGGLVNTTYQALILQNQVETGLSKVSLSSETEPDYLLYHMIMKLIEEKAYKLDDLTEKVSVFYLYEKLSDEQFETIYSALYPFVEDEIVEEPVVEELPEVVEDEVIM
nr:MAG TPA: hypothetical protein [Caudoviricetes sp.]